MARQSHGHLIPKLQNVTDFVHNGVKHTDELCLSFKTFHLRYNGDWLSEIKDLF